MASGAHLIGQMVGEYEIVRRMGLGGMGVVYEGRHPLIGKRVAVKVLLPELSEDQETVKRFLAEARAVNAIRHRGIVDIFAFGELPDGARYFVMEYLEGLSFQELLQRRKSLPVAEALGFMDEILEAVAAAHQAGVVHRDLKPSNVFLVDAGRGRPWVKILDFGVAKRTGGDPHRSGNQKTGIVGTPTYMAPEQITGAAVGPWTDLYALGVMLFELVSGQPPFEADSPVAMMGRHLDAPPPRLGAVVRGVPPALDALIKRLLAKRGADRPQDAETVRTDLAHIRAELENGARAGPVPVIDEADLGPTVVRPAPEGPRPAGPLPGPGVPVHPGALVWSALEVSQSGPVPVPMLRHGAPGAGSTEDTDSSRARTRLAVSSPSEAWDRTDRDLSAVRGRDSAGDDDFDQPPTVLDLRGTGPAVVLPETTVPEARPLGRTDPDTPSSAALTERAPAVSPLPRQPAVPDTIPPGASVPALREPVAPPGPRRISLAWLVVLTAVLTAVGALLGLALIP